MTKAKGFTLIELLIVVAIILVICAIAIPNLLRSRIAANEASAAQSIRAITTAQIAYAQIFPTVGYTCTLTHLGPPPPGQPVSSTGGGMLDSALASGVKAGYNFSLSNCSSSPVSAYNSAAVPAALGSTGVRSFCSDATGTIWLGADGTAATCQSAGIALN